MRHKTLLGVMLLTLVTLVAGILSVPDHNLHVIFCDVGQGDGALIQRGNTQLLIDTGPNDKILDCLSAHMPFFDKTIEATIITHPQQDHMGGLPSVMGSYHIAKLFIPPAQNPIRVYRDLVDKYAHSAIQVSNLYTGDIVKVGEVQFQAVWPSRDFMARHATPNSTVLGWSTDGTDLNGFSIVGILSLDTFDVLFTGDADAPVEPAEMATGLLRGVEILKVPHHGSKTGMTEAWLETVSPQVAVISVGKTNRYGHPTAQALELLSKFTNQIYRIDEQGSLEFVSDGQTFWRKIDKGVVGD